MFERLENRSVIEISGKDAGKFLQNITTNDIIKNNYCYSFWLSNQGRYLFDFHIFNDFNGRFLVDIDRNQLEAFVKRIKMFKLRSEFDLTDKTSDVNVIYSKEKVEQSICSFQDPRYNSLWFRSIVEKNLFNSDESEQDLYLKHKYDFCIPDGSIDLITEKSIPIEYGAEELNAISYDKGCYVGQEVISRAKYQGEVRKKLYLLEADANFSEIEQGCTVKNTDSDKLGTVCSVYKNYAIAILREAKVKEESVVIDGIKCIAKQAEWYSILS